MISVIVAVYNQHDLTRDCLNKIGDGFEVVIVDNGSEPPFEVRGDEILIRNEENLGFPVAVNQGISRSTGDIICLLNNDVILPEGWETGLVNGLSEYDIVGPMSNYVAGLQKVVIGPYTSISEFEVAAAEWRSKYYGEYIPVKFVIGLCMMFKRELYDAVGPFDESKWPCSGEEIDFCLRVVARGGKVAIAKGYYVHHFGSMTFKDMEGAGEIQYQEICAMCDSHLAEKWGEDFWERQAASTLDVDVLRMRHDGDTVWIVGDGPSLKDLNRSDIGFGPIIAVNSAITTVERVMGHRENVYAMQKDGGNRKPIRNDLSPECRFAYDCKPECGGIRRPKYAALILHRYESMFCYPEHHTRYIFDVMKLGNPGNTFSLACAVDIAVLMGCNNIVFVSCDAHVNGAGTSKHRAQVPFLEEKLRSYSIPYSFYTPGGVA